MRRFKEWWQRVDAWWFPQGSPTTLGVFRILFGFWAFCNQLMLLGDFRVWFTEQGLVPIELQSRYFSQVSIGDAAVPRIDLFSMFSVNPKVGLALYLLITLSAVTTMLGLWTRASSIVLALGIVSLHHRNALILHGGDVVLRVACLYIALAPSGAACSLDRILGLWKGRIKPGPVVVNLWVQRLIMFNVALIYFTTVWHKWGGSYWREGIATWFPNQLNEFKRFPIPGFMENLLIVKLTTYGTLATELALATLVFYKPLRKYVLLAGILMHGFIEYSMNIPLFSFMMVSLYLSFYEGEEVSGWFRRLGSRCKKFAVEVMTPAGQRLQPAPHAALKALDPLDLVTYADGDEEVWAGKKADGERRSAMWLSSSRSMGAWSFAWIPGLWRRLLNSALEERPSAKLKPGSNGRAKQEPVRVKR